jgi:predicted GNAT family N-acyltransferase
MTVVVDEVKFGSYIYEETHSLRRAILRTPLGIDFSDEEIADEQNLIHLAAMKDGILAGALVLKPHEDGKIQLKQMCVEPIYRRAKVGSLLIRHAERITKMRKVKDIWLNARLDVQVFYERSGYLASGEPYSRVGIPHIYMAKIL